MALLVAVVFLVPALVPAALRPATAVGMVPTLGIEPTSASFPTLPPEWTHTPVSPPAPHAHTGTYQHAQPGWYQHTSGGGRHRAAQPGRHL